MQYGQIVSLFAVCFLLYYAFMVVSDILKARAVQAAGHEDKSEEDIDISDEIGTFKPVMVSRDGQTKDGGDSLAAESTVGQENGMAAGKSTRRPATAGRHDGRHPRGRPHGRSQSSGGDKLRRSRICDIHLRERKVN